MKRVIIILSLLLFACHYLQAQEEGAVYQIRIFESDLEKQILLHHQEEPFAFLQALNGKKLIDKEVYFNRILSSIDVNLLENHPKKFLKKLIKEVNREHLKNYQISSTFSETLTDGIYDCVTGTALFSLLLLEFDVEHHVVETPGHVLIEGRIADQAFILESTLPRKSLFWGDESVKRFKKSYMAENDPNSSLNFQIVGSFPNSSPSNFWSKEIGLQELAGLQYYNQAVEKFFEKDYLTALAHLVKAYHFYPCERVMTFKTKLEEFLVLKD